MPLPMRPSHVHCYLLEGRDGWTLVDTGLSMPESDECSPRSREELTVARIVDHALPSRPRGRRAAGQRRATGATVHQGALDYEQCAARLGKRRLAPGDRRLVPSERRAAAEANELLEAGSVYAPFIRYVRDPELLHAGDVVDGWDVLAMPGHADGHLALVATVSSSRATICCRGSRRRSASIRIRAPTRSATTSTRSSAPRRSASAARPAGPRRADARPDRARSGDRRAPP